MLLDNVGPELMAALAVARDKIGPIVARDSTARVRTKKGDSYSYSFASLQRVLETVSAHLRDAGIEPVTVPYVEDGKHFVYGALVLVSDPTQYLPGVLDLGEQETMQDLGGAITYARRYLVQSLVGVASEEDTDRGAPRQRAPAPKDQADRLRDLVAEKITEGRPADAEPITRGQALDEAESMMVTWRNHYNRDAGPWTDEEANEAWHDLASAALDNAVESFGEWLAAKAPF